MFRYCNAYVQWSLWNYYRDEANSGAEGNINYSTEDSKSFDYKTKITQRLEGSDTEKEVEIVVPTVEAIFGEY